MTKIVSRGSRAPFPSTCGGEEHQHYVVVPIHALCKQSRAGRVAHLRLPTQREVTVRRRRRLRKRDAVAKADLMLHPDAVRGTVAARKRHAQSKLDLEIDEILAFHTRVEHRRRHPARVRNYIGRRPPTCSRERNLFREGLAGNVARPHHHREAQIEPTGLVANVFLVFELHLHLFVRPNVRHRHGEDVRTLLLEKRHLLSSLLRLLVNLARLLFFLDLSLDHPLANHHTEGVDR